MDEAAVWSALPAEEQRSVWDDTESNFWPGFEQQQDALRAAAEHDYQNATLEVRVEMGTLTGKRTQLAETRERLSRELTMVEEELARVAEACDENATKLINMEQDYRKREQERLEKREQVIKTMEDFFRMKRGQDSDAEPERRRRHDHGTAASTIRPRRIEPLHQNTLMEEVQHTNGQTTPAMTTSAAATAAAAAAVAAAAPAAVREEPAEALVNVTDADGNIIGPVEKIEPWNLWVKEILHMPVKRQVKIRRGRKFGQEHLATIYDRSEGKGVKWLSCMIQATGEIQPRRCHSCDKNQGAFDECIILGGPTFQKCGNCEWNRQGCHLPLVSKSGNAGTPPKGRAFKKEPDQPDQPDQPGQAAAAVEYAESAALKARRDEAVQEALAKAAGLVPVAIAPAPAPRETEATDSAPPAHKSPVAQEPMQMPTPQEPKEHTFVSSTPAANTGFNPASGFTPACGFTPANARSRAPSGEIPTPSVVSTENSPRPTPPPPSDFLEDITHENLVLRHNGTVYTYPEIVEGVPLAKIDQDHPYWELGWPSIQSLVEPQLASWREKNNAALEAIARGGVGSAKFQTGRQVNRGAKILEFLDKGDISPYQLLSKKYTHVGKGAITSYDTLFRLCESLSELGKFNLDVTPVEWLRHRLYEIMLEKGPSFNVAKTIHDFYHDPKLSALRTKNGFKSIGRPSGYKPGQSSGTPQSSSKKRKGRHSQTGTPRDTPSAAPSPLATEEAEQSPQTSAPSETAPDTYPSKRAKRVSPALGTAHVESQCADYSDTDSWSGAPLAKEDWRIYQVKTRLFTSSTQVTQYWNWKENGRLFEHQVLKDTNPITWGVHREPIDFNVQLDDIVEVRWNLDELQVHLVMSSWGTAVAKQDGMPRGDVLAAFKRVRSFCRFLGFCRERRLKTVEVSREEIARGWESMQSEKLPDTDDEVSVALRE
ncbi:Uncharacterized protein TCAP_05899 [Tolypocladium capitatum]|uniref:Uncharacterized protein n=1 Tax=Tolypocladium capitatum TaxID=45235 RepID=A0A2K3Q9J8_9HYPO|nr:Uncharacterized protein TCAP_05899 [Tolypocladium capitatum]